jgi:hypothetical protein
LEKDPVTMLVPQSGHADAALKVTVAQGTALPPYSPVSWDPYGGAEAIILAIVLLAVAGIFVYAGKRLGTPLRIERPGKTVEWFMFAIWALAVCTLGAAWSVFGLRLQEAYPYFVEPRVHVHIFTIIDAVVAFFAIVYLTRRWGAKVVLHSAVIGTAAAWMIFEFPFDLVVMMRTNPPIPNHTMLYRLLFFLPLFLVECSTVSLLTSLPSMRVTACAAYAVAGMFTVFAVWAAFGFAFPAEPLPFALNVISKILSFVAAIMLFVWKADEEVAKAGT